MMLTLTAGYTKIKFWKKVLPESSKLMPINNLESPKFLPLIKAFFKRAICTLSKLEKITFFEKTPFSQVSSGFLSFLWNESGLIRFLVKNYA